MQNGQARPRSSLNCLKRRLRLGGPTGRGAARPGGLEAGSGPATERNRRSRETRRRRRRRQVYIRSWRWSPPSYTPTSLRIGGAMYYLINAALRFFGELKVICLPLGSEWELTLSDVYVAPRPPIHGVQSGGYASNGMWGPNSSYKHHMLPPTTLPPPRALQPRALTSPPLALTSPPPADRRADRPPAGGNRVTQNRVRILTYAPRPRGRAGAAGRSRGPESGDRRRRGASGADARPAGEAQST